LFNLTGLNGGITDLIEFMIFSTTKYVKAALSNPGGNRVSGCSCFTVSGAGWWMPTIPDEAVANDCRNEKCTKQPGFYQTNQSIA